MVIVVAGCSSPQTNQSEDVPVIGVVQLVEHTSLNIIKNAIFEQFDNLGYVDGENCVIKFVNAQGDVANLPTIMQNLKADNVDIVVAITTPVAQAALSLSPDIPVIFSAISISRC